MNQRPIADESLFPQANAVLRDALSSQQIVGAVVLIARDGQIVHQRAAGWLDREARRPMREDAIFRLSSLTKPIVSATALALVERGVIHLDDTLQRWLPSLRLRTADGKAATITLRQLLTHTAGLDYGFFQTTGGPYHVARVSDGLADAGLGIDEQLRRLAAVPLSFAPGTVWRYSVGLDVLGEVLARAAGQTLPALVRRYVCDPLHMHDTAFTVRDAERLATPYADGTPPPRMADLHEVTFIEGLAGIRFAPSRIFHSRSYASGGAGMAGSAPDFMRFLLAIANGGGPILQRESARAMMQNQIGPLRIDVEPTRSWGFGFGGAVLLNRDLAGERRSNGTWRWGGVYGHHWFVDPGRSLAVTVMTNTAMTGMSSRFTEDLQAAIYAAL
ncbi:serine hydrolase [Pandoraea sp.]|uniref:serine hydrolase domain-containing protein n=1 Tax=Pandoraea sp. TaxID=1883445 RepID=UPI0012291292|nr:serine hydrolase domain-containing protein [Pandoraea sp.]TAL56811.1 MAG: class A beta-lactamase-related serine hydrolase [Pandoraea sp.]TAM15637.1 MAG: class A beta-lactamase-related serine hydrolase [Pandoraea sp.]